MRTNDCWNFNNLNDLLISSQAYSIITSCYYVYVCVVVFSFSHFLFLYFIFITHFSFLCVCIMGCRCLRQSEGVCLPMLHCYESKACSLLLFFSSRKWLRIESKFNRWYKIKPNLWFMFAHRFILIIQWLWYESNVLFFFFYCIIWKRIKLFKNTYAALLKCLFHLDCSRVNVGYLINNDAKPWYKCE